MTEVGCQIVVGRELFTTRSAALYIRVRCVRYGHAFLAARASQEYIRVACLASLSSRLGHGVADDGCVASFGENVASSVKCWSLFSWIRR